MTRGARTIGALLVGGLMFGAISGAEEAKYDCQLLLLKVPLVDSGFAAEQASMVGGAFMATGPLSVTWGDSVIKSDGANLRWNGVELPLRPETPPPGASVKVMATPRITTPLGGRGSQLKAGVDEPAPAQYFEREADGRFALRVTPVAPMLDFTFTLEKTGTPDALRLGWTYDLVKLGERKPLPGVSLPVGPPDIRKLSARSAGDVKLGQWCLIAFRESSGLAVFLKILPQH